MALTQLTERQKHVYEFIHDLITNRGYGPTVREIGHEFSISSPNGVMCHLKALEKKGLIRRSPNKSRAIELVNQGGGRPKGMPMVGVVAAGMTSLAFEQDERVDFDAMFAKPGQFALRVNGDSMIEAQIADGDYVIVRRQATASSGDMVVAQTEEGEATLKYWFPENGRIRLQPANSTMQPIYLDRAIVLGVVVGIIRQVA
ncbi:MAG: transcriptional repressor LexA [Pirellulaceae bacterium]|jgi:repressor LexA|nr:transcriptional repressor LexA [Pirellulaceae bacterium]HJN13154.1 transcriptional repressor LexA [Pirellulaceae bacterium]